MRIDPGTINGLQARWDAYAVSTVGNTSAVFQVLDKSGAGRTLSRTGAGVEPTWSVVSGKPRVTLFDQKFLQTSATAAPISVGGSRTIFVAGGGAANGGNMLVFGDGAAKFDLDFAISSISAGRIYSNRNPANSAKIASGYTAFSSQFVACMTAVVGSLPTLRINGVAQTVSIDQGTGLVGSETSADHVYVGYTSAVGGQSGYDGYWNEILIYSGVLAASEIARVEAYLAARWGGI